MKKEINPVVAGVVLAVVVAVIGYFVYTRSAGTTFSKSESRGIQFDASKAKLPNSGQ
ncbi:MAG: hypothetical protein NT029_13070 [Armatimonadetes bacterium]|nr:hypothetical protein [Armatimonadota bacterium]